MKKGLLFLLLLSATTVWAQSKEESSIAAAVQALHDAIVATDSSRLSNLATDELSFGHSSGAVEDKQTFIRNAVHGPFRFLSMATTNQTITLAKRTAVVRHVLTAKATNNGAPADVKLGVLQVWQKKRGGWKLLARQAVRVS